MRKRSCRRTPSLRPTRSSRSALRPPASVCGEAVLPRTRLPRRKRRRARAERLERQRSAAAGSHTLADVVSGHRADREGMDRDRPAGATTAAARGRAAAASAVPFANRVVIRGGAQQADQRAGPWETNSCRDHTQPDQRPVVQGAGRAAAVDIRNRTAAAADRHCFAADGQAANHMPASRDRVGPGQDSAGRYAGQNCAHARNPVRVRTGRAKRAVEADSWAGTAAAGSAATAATAARLAAAEVAQRLFLAAIEDGVAVQQVEIGLATQSFDPSP